MSLTLDPAVIAGKNKLHDDKPFVTLLQLTLPGAGSPSLFFADNTEVITYGGQSHTPLIYLLDEEKEAGDGSLPTRQLRIGNAARALNPQLDAYKGLVDGTIAVVEVYANASPATLVKQQSYSILAATANLKFIVFTLGLADPLRRRYPLYAANANSCPWKFKDQECTPASPSAEWTAATTCDRTRNNCAALKNTKRFGARPGVLGAPRFV